MFTIGESRAIFPSDDTELNSKQKKWLEILDFQPKLHREHRLAQQRRQHSDHKHVQRQRQKTTITLQMEPMKRGNTDHRRFKKRWGDQATLSVYSKIVFFDATIGSNSYTICRMHVKNIFPPDWGQPISLYTMSNIGFLQWALFYHEQFITPIMCDM